VPPAAPTPAPEAITGYEPKAANPLVRLVLGVVVAGFAAFWIWALFFASKEAVNRVDDREWAERAQGICEEAEAERFELADFRRLDEPTPELIRERAEIVDESTRILATMLDRIEAVPPADEKGQAIVPQWIDEYRTYLQDRRDYADRLRETGENQAFYETEADGLPISERLETFAGDNEMPACAPPRDLSR
jgi:hypothetical protein